MKKLAIVGVGLIGGSIGLALKKKNLVEEVIGIGRRQESLNKALKLGAVDRATLDFREGVKDANLAIVATPVDIISEMIKRMLSHLPQGAIITDVGSTKEQIVREVNKVFYPKGHKLEGASFVGGHPMAGSEKRGVESAKADLFEKSVCILTPGETTSSEVLDTVKWLWESIGATVLVMKPKEHDFLVAAVSHLPHLVATALVNLVGELRERDERILSLVASGFKDTTRIAGSPPALWQDICLTNKKNIATMIDRLIGLIGEMKKCIVEEDGAALLKEFEKARSLRDEL